jgi:Mrr N-terminal domain/Meiotically up-regulated gene 113
LRAPILDAKDRENWRYCLFREARVGDVVYHYDANLAAVTASSIIAGEAEPCRIEWVAHGSSARKRGAVAREVDGYRVPLERTEWLPKPLTLEELRSAKELLFSIEAAAHAKNTGPHYFPFELSKRPVRPLQGYAFKLSAAFVTAFPQLARVEPEGTAAAGGDDCRHPNVPSIYVYMFEMLDTLRAFGGAATSDQVCDWFVDRRIARERDLITVQKHGETRFRKEVRFARLALTKAGLLEGNEWGYWRLSPRGWKTHLDIDGARAIASRRLPAALGKDRYRAELHSNLSTPRVAPGPSKGPRPVAWEGVVRRLLAVGASTYVMRFGATPIWKIGYATNVTKRLAELNRHVPVEVLDCRWALVREVRWNDPRLAYEMEQRVLNELADHRTTGERVRCSDEEMGAAWGRASSYAIPSSREDVQPAS